MICTADYPRKNRFKASKPKKTVSSSKEQSPKLLPAKGHLVDQYVVQEIQDETGKAGVQSQCLYRR